MTSNQHPSVIKQREESATNIAIVLAAVIVAFAIYFLYVDMPDAPDGYQCWREFNVDSPTLIEKVCMSPGNRF